ncbi:MAG TPA: RIP metalloprotease RseP [Chromatiaceae bacterium]|jgi:regulator of sigma E protease|nr:RIP metalloprotease RseP [Chromatiaceae bacterium]HIB84618.1 RIP metalloprotease RseP [Chromatiaceae bacterium]HIO14562.1 RIP metalloprotease RseP [Chromatiales bacterium]
MSGFFSTLGSFLVALSILIAVHEFGHFWVARRLGVKVLRFSIGFGKPLLSIRRGPDATEYVLAILPLGGYVKMLDEREGKVAAADVHRAFNRQSLPVRSAIVVAGPLFNFLFAIVAYWCVFVTGDTGTRPVVGSVTADSIAATAGFMIGDTITDVGKEPTPTWEGVVISLIDQAGDGDLTIRVRDVSDREVLRYLPGTAVDTHSQSPRMLAELGLAVYRPTLPAVIGGVVAASPAQNSGLVEGDRIVLANGEAIDSWQVWVDYVRARPDQVIAIEVERGMQRLPLSIQPEQRSDEDGKVFGRIGAFVQVSDEYFDEFRVKLQYSPLEALQKSAQKTWQMSSLMLRMLWRMIAGKISTDTISGPISIAQYAGASAQIGLLSFIKFLAIVSISLGVLNLLPIPVLDGGHLLFFGIEAIKGSAVSDQAQEFGLKIGITLLALLMGLAFYNDFVRVLS